MKKTFIILVIMFNFFNKTSANYTELAHNFEFKSIDGQSIKISDYKEICENWRWLRSAEIYSKWLKWY